MRCPDCSKFVSFDEPNADNIEVSFDETTISLSGELVLPCADCGADLASASLEAELDVQGLVYRTEDGNLADDPDEEAGETAEYEMEDDPDVETGETGGGRYIKKYYTATATGTVTRIVRDKQGEEVPSRRATAEFELEAREQASAFEPMS